MSQGGLEKALDNPAQRPRLHLGQEERAAELERTSQERCLEPRCCPAQAGGSGPACPHAQVGRGSGWPLVTAPLCWAGHLCVHL